MLKRVARALDFRKCVPPYKVSGAYKTGGTQDKSSGNGCAENVDKNAVLCALKTWIKKKCASALDVRERVSDVDCEG